MKNHNIKICDTTIYPGETANLALPLPEQYSFAPMYMPIKVTHGLEKGPCVLIFSVLKGNELNGLEIANRIIKSIKPSEIRGTIITIPVMNVYGLTSYPARVPSNHDLAKCFPGNEQGSFGERIAYLFNDEILKKADYCIELQTGDINHNILPQVYCNFENKVGKNLAKAFGAPVVTNANLENNPLRITTEKLGVPLLIYQAGEALRFDENAIILGVNGIKNVLKTIDVLQKEPIKEVKPIFSREEDWIIAHKSGILHTSVSLGQIIEENELIGEISDPFGADIIEPIRSNRKGIVVGINTAPIIYEGLELFKVLSFSDYDKAETAIEEWDKKQPDSFIG